MKNYSEFKYKIIAYIFTYIISFVLLCMLLAFLLGEGDALYKIQGGLLFLFFPFWLTSFLIKFPIPNIAMT